MKGHPLHREFLSSTATFSKCRKYRYTLSRTWDRNLPAACWILLNPSTADERVLDPTLRRCLGFSRDWGFGTMWIANAFAFRSPYPRHMYTADDPIGPRNDAHIRRLAKNAGKVIVGWGVHGALQNRSASVMDLLDRCNVEAWCLGLTNERHPKHPLYVSKSTPLIKFSA